MNVEDLPYPEDIYDLDTFELKDLVDKIETELNLNENSENDQFLIFKKKGIKILQLAKQEVKERKQVENFGNFCTIEQEDKFFQNLNDYQPQQQIQNKYQQQHYSTDLIRVDNYNNYQQQQQTDNDNEKKYLFDQNNLINWHNIQNLLQNQEYQQQNYNIAVSQQESTNNTISVSDQKSQNQQNINTSQEDFFSSQKDNDTISQYSENSIQSTYSYAHSKKNLKRSGSKQKISQQKQNFNNFTRDLLQRTKITDNKVIDQTKNSNTIQYNPYTELKPNNTKKRQASKSKSQSNMNDIQKSNLNKTSTNNFSYQQKESDQYKNVQSKIKQNMHKKSSTQTSFFSTGKPAISSRYIPPKPKKSQENTRQHKSAYLKKRQNSGMLEVVKPQTASSSSAHKRSSSSQQIQRRGSQDTKAGDLKVNQLVDSKKKDSNSIQKKQENKPLQEKQQDIQENISKDNNQQQDDDDDNNQTIQEQDITLNNSECTLQSSIQQVPEESIQQSQTTFQDQEEIEEQDKKEQTIVSKNNNDDIDIDIDKKNIIENQQHQQQKQRIFEEDNQQILSNHELDKPIVIQKNIEDISQDTTNNIDKENKNNNGWWEEQEMNRKSSIESEEQQSIEDLKQQHDQILQQQESDNLQLQQDNQEQNNNNISDLNEEEKKEEYLNMLRNQIRKKFKYSVNQIIEEEAIEESQLIVKNNLSQQRKSYYKIEQIENEHNNEIKEQDYQDEEDNGEEQIYSARMAESNRDIKEKMQKLLDSIQDEKLRETLIQQTKSLSNSQEIPQKQIQQKDNSKRINNQSNITKEGLQQKTQNNNKNKSVQPHNYEKQKDRSIRTKNPLQNIGEEEKQKQLQEIFKKPPIPSQKKKPKQQQQNPITNKLILKMMVHIQDDSLIDYTDMFPSFNHLFSGFYNIEDNIINAQQNPNQIQVLDQMLDQFSMFGSHYEKIDKQEKMLQVSYKTAVSSLEVTPSERYYMSDPQKVLIYSNKVGIDMRTFVERQIILQKRIQGQHNETKLSEDQNTLFYRVVRNKTEVYDIISRSFLRTHNWNELPHGMNLKTTWNLLWTWSKPHIDFNKLIYFQKVNHFPFNKNLARKDLLKKNLERIKKLGSKAAHVFDILPVTFVLPKEYCAFSEKFYEDKITEPDDNIWIIKPIGKSRGRGISLVNDISQVVYAEPIVVQKYLKNPLLIKGYKFDLRIYVLVTSFKPLEAFIYNEGFARISTEKYNMDPQNISNNMVHLTNYSIQKHNTDVIQQGQNIIGGTKITLRMLREELQQHGIIWSKIWGQIEQICQKSLIACQQDIPHNPNCFEIFGYDIMIDDEQKCSLIEINTSPSLARDYIIDDLIKQQLIDDTIALVDPVNFDRERLLEVLDRRIKEQQGQKSSINTQNNSKLQLNRDLNYILKGKKIRKFGELPQFMGQYTRICPSEYSNKLLKLVQSYKIPSKKSNHTTIDL